MWLASFFALAATACADSMTDEPAVTSWRLAKPPSPSGARAVSPDVTLMSLAATPRCCAQICESAVARP
jgi:hypothetical protein